MVMERRSAVTKMILAAMFLLVPLASAFAYVDPGTGSMIVQVVIAALVGGGSVHRRVLAEAVPEAPGPGR